MSNTDVEAELGHEITHVSNGNMVTLTLIQAVVNIFVIFFSKLCGIFIDSMLRGRDQQIRGPGIGSFIAQMVDQMVLGVLVSIIVMWFSSMSEFRADAGGEKLSGREKMIAALECLKMNYEQATLSKEMAAWHLGRWWLEPTIHDTSLWMKV